VTNLVTDNVYCLVKIIEKDEGIIAAVQFEIKLFDFFSTSLNSSLIIFIWTYTVNYRNALDRLCVHMNIILFRHVADEIADSVKKGQVLDKQCVIVVRTTLGRVYQSSNMTHR